MIESARGQYSPTFAGLDTWIAAASQHHAQLLYTFDAVPHWAATAGTEPPSDLHATNETCEAPLAGVTRPNGDCIWTEFVTKLMQHVCQVGSAPTKPLIGVCRIRIFESWNEFNDNQYWTSNYADMARMANDAATVVKQYCGDCTFLAGNTSAGGDGYIPKYYHDPTVSPLFDLALGQMLDAWYALPNHTLPDAVSFHAYGARNMITPYPMPETNVSHSDSRCSAQNTPNVFCRLAIFDEAPAVRAVLKQRPWAANLPIWNTEGGFGRNDDMTDGVNETDQNTSILRQAYVARWLLAMGSSGTAVNLWYVWDDPCWGTMLGRGIAPSSTGCPNDPMIPPGNTPAFKAWTITTGWLSGATFTGPCTNQGEIWRCTITKPGGYQGMFLWTTGWLASTSVNLGTNPYHQWRDLDGNVNQLNGRTSVTASNRPILLE